MTNGIPEWTPPDGWILSKAPPQHHASRPRAVRRPDHCRADGGQVFGLPGMIAEISPIPARTDSPYAVVVGGRRMAVGIAVSRLASGGPGPQLGDVLVRCAAFSAASAMSPRYRADGRPPCSVQDVDRGEHVAVERRHPDVDLVVDAGVR